MVNPLLMFCAIFYVLRTGIQWKTLIWRRGYADHIRSRCEEKGDKQNIPGYRAGRWVCERTHSWMNRYRSILVRWEKKTENYLALLHLICAIMLWKATRLFSG